MQISSNVFLFCVRLLVYEALFLFKMPRRKKFVLRISVTVAVLAAYMLIVAFVWNLTTIISPFRMTYFIIFCFLTIVAICSCFNISWKEAFFFGSAAFALMQSATYAATAFRYFIKIDNAVIDAILFEYLNYIIVCIIMYFIFVRPLRSGQLMLKNDVKYKLLFLLIFVIFFTSVLSRGNEPSASWILSLYAAICCWLVVFMQFDAANKNKLLQEKQEIERLFHVKEEQRELSKKTIEAIRMKYHDIKHLLSGLETIEDKEGRKEFKKYIANIRKEIAAFDRIAETGNKALDVVLTEKSFFCNNYNIDFTYMADGEKLNFMSALDIYVLFGNALDNAIESVDKEEITGNRTISLKVVMVNNMILIHVENYCSQIIQLNNEGIPLTLKENPEYHGLGIKSMKYVVEKYRGELRTNLIDKKFILDILFSPQYVQKE